MEKLQLLAMIQAYTGVGIEIATCTNVVCTGNSILAQGVGANQIPLQLNNSMNCTVAANSIDGGGTSDSSARIAANTSSASNTCSHNVIASNVVVFPASGQGAGIKVFGPIKCT